MGGADGDGGYAAAIVQWHDFYELAGTAAAALIGLIFLAISLRPRLVARGGAAGLRAWAEQALSNLAGVLVISLVVVIPHQDPWSIGAALLATAGIGLAAAAVRLRAIRADAAWLERHHRAESGFQVAGYLVVLAVGVAAFGGDPGVLNWLVAATFLLVWSAIRCCWQVVEEVGRDAQQDGTSG